MSVLVFIAVTDTQIMNMFNIKVNYYYNDYADLYVESSSRISESLVKSIEHTKQFRNIYRINRQFESSSGKLSKYSIIRYAQKFINALKERNIIYHRLSQIRDIGYYSNVILPYLIRLDVLAPIYKKNHNMKISFVEEGAGSVFEEKESFKLNHVIQNKIKKILNELFWFLITGKREQNLRDILFSRVDCLYLSQPELYSVKNKFPVKKLPNVSVSNPLFKKVLQDTVSELDYSEYEKRKICFLISSGDVITQGDYVSEETLERQKICIEHINMLAECFGNDLIVKDHPRFSITDSVLSTFNNVNSNVFVDQRRYLLEGLFSKLDLNNKIFITTDSLVLIHPKVLFDCEPYVLFTYKLFPEKYFAGSPVDRYVSGILKIYNDKSKIMVPKDTDEMINMIKITMSLLK